MAFTKLTELALFDGLSRRDLNKIRSICTPVTIHAGHEITRIGTYGRECLLIESGTVVVERDGATIAEIGPGELVGEMALLSGPSGARSATTRALTDCEALVFTPAEFHQLLNDFPVVAERIVDIAAGRLASAPAAA